MLVKGAPEVFSPDGPTDDKWSLVEAWGLCLRAPWSSDDKVLLYSVKCVFKMLYILSVTLGLYVVRWPISLLKVERVLVFSCDQAALWMVQSVCLSVRLSVCPSHLFHYVPIIISSWNFQELLPMTEVMSMQKVNVKGQGDRGQNPT